jgi:hypothetical protein
VVGNGSWDVPYWQLRVCNKISSSVVRRILWSVVSPVGVGIGPPLVEY